MWGCEGERRKEKGGGFYFSTGYLGEASSRYEEQGSVQIWGRELWAYL